MNLRSIMAAIGEISTPKRRGEVISVVEQKLYILGKKLGQLEAEHKEAFQLLEFLRKLPS